MVPWGCMTLYGIIVLHICKGTNSAHLWIMGLKRHMANQDNILVKPNLILQDSLVSALS